MDQEMPMQGMPQGPQMPQEPQGFPIPPEAMDYAKEAIASNVAAPAMLDRKQAMDELHSWATTWLNDAQSWRKTSYEADWAKWQRAADAIYEPSLAAKKLPDQSKAFVPVTPSHRETIKAQIYKTMAGTNPPLEVKGRPHLPPEMDQGEDVKDITIREMERSRFSVGCDDILEDATTLGSGFARLRYETLMEDRYIQEAVLEEVLPPWQDWGQSAKRAMTGQRQVIGYKKVMKPTIVYRGVRFEHLSTWDIFPDPKALCIKGNAIAYRFWQNYGDIVRGVEEGWALPEALERLKNVVSGEVTPQDKQEVEADRGISASNVKRTEYGTKHESFEWWVRVPQKWLYAIVKDAPEITDPEKLVPARVIFCKATLIAVEISDQYDGEAPIEKCDYWPVAGRFFARGIPEMLKDVQLVSNEAVNQRLDDGALKLKTLLGVIEKAIVNPNDVKNAQMGGVIRLNQNAFGGQPFKVDDVVSRVHLGGIDSAAFIEPQEWERWGQERTSANRVTLAVRGPGGDSNETLGGMQLNKQTAGEKFGYIGMNMEARFLYEVFRSYWKLIYANYNPEDVAMAIGPERAARFQMLTPEQVENAYVYIPLGVFSAENKAMRQARLLALRKEFLGAPWLNDLEIFKAAAASNDEDADRFIVPEADALMILQKAGEMAEGMVAQQQEQEAQENPGNPGKKESA